MKIANIPNTMNQENFDKLVNQINVFMRSVGLENMQGQIIENIYIPATISIEIAHSLKVTPKYRIILKQVNGGAIIDGDTDWTETKISLKNTGATDALISVILLRS